ncbi:hypothetical protein CSQ96_09055 [Janthinobacterium sp. BJB412]|nr:hypothetical protein CSQ96_09055 [Janthinobacterium sp. BJB412]
MRGRQGQAHQLRHLTPAALAALAQRGGGRLALRQLGRLLRAELAGVGYDWRALFRAEADAVAALRGEIAAAAGPCAWQLVLADYATGAVIDEGNEPDWNLRALGQVTNGTYFFVSSLEMIARQARQIADDLLSTLPYDTRRVVGKPVYARTEE